MADLMTRTLQVRLNDEHAMVHKIVGQWFDAGHGHVYETRCGKELRATRSAMRTTRDVDCEGCRPGRTS